MKKEFEEKIKDCIRKTDEIIQEVEHVDGDSTAILVRSRNIRYSIIRAFRLADRISVSVDFRDVDAETIMKKFIKEHHRYY